MKDFYDIEKEYLRLEPLDNLALERYYFKHIDYFKNLQYDNTKQFSKCINIMIDIACSYSFAGRHAEAINIIDHIKRLIKNKIPLDCKKNFNQLNFCAGHSHFALRNYRLALYYLKTYQTTSKDKIKIEILTQICRDKLRNKALLILAGLGLTTLIIKYSTKYFLTDYHSSFIDKLGWFGALTLISYGLFFKSTGKKNTA